MFNIIIMDFKHVIPMKMFLELELKVFGRGRGGRINLKGKSWIS